ncbi:hypothetical protein Tco_1222916 [Tanacetum coccineum]
MLGATRVQIPKNNLDDLHSSREEDGTSETMDLQDLLGSVLLVDIDLIILGLLTGTLVLDFLGFFEKTNVTTDLGVSLSRSVGFLRGTSSVEPDIREKDEKSSQKQQNQARNGKA